MMIDVRMNVTARDLIQTNEPEGLLLVGGRMHGERIRDFPVRDRSSTHDYARNCYQQTYRVWVREPMPVTFAPTDPVEMTATIETVTYEIREIAGLYYLEEPACVLSRLWWQVRIEPVMKEFVFGFGRDPKRRSLNLSDLDHLHWVMTAAITDMVQPRSPIRLDEDFRIEATPTDALILFDDERFRSFMADRCL